VFAILDWQRDHKPLDTELRKIVPEGEGGKRFIDKLMKAYRRDSGDMRLLHAEVQCQKEDEFERRMHVYNYRIEDVYSHPVLTLVVLGDDDPDWRPHEYRFEEEGVCRTLSFTPVKLLDYAGRLEELERHENPFGVLVVAHLVSRQTRSDVATRKAWKLRLLRGLYDRKLDAEDLRQWYRFVDWLLDLPVEENRQVWQEIQKIEQEKHMPYVTSVEQIGYERGLEEGARALRELIEHWLERKFGEEGKALMPEVRKIEAPTRLKAVADVVVTAPTLDDVRRALA
jgi:hypothetical protein